MVRLAAVYSRELGDSVLTLSASGFTYDNTFVLYDYETESLWYHLPGTDGLTCISGVYADKKLVELPSKFLRWKDWVQQQPATLYLKFP
ncbi:MAG: hypothetical protein Kow0037_11470 [Calditrichia bacterium]